MHHGTSARTALSGSMTGTTTGTLLAATSEGAAVGFLDRLKSRAETVVQRDPGSVGVTSEFAFVDVEMTGPGFREGPDSRDRNRRDG